jgi:hypothetical protein
VNVREYAQQAAQSNTEAEQARQRVRAADRERREAERNGEELPHRQINNRTGMFFLLASLNSSLSDPFFLLVDKGGERDRQKRLKR